MGSSPGDYQPEELTLTEIENFFDMDNVFEGANQVENTNVFGEQQSFQWDGAMFYPSIDSTGVWDEQLNSLENFQWDIAISQPLNTHAGFWETQQDPQDNIMFQPSVEYPDTRGEAMIPLWHDTIFEPSTALV
ncbi:uncharacterized protein CTRU02_205069 [Colletotrichum truncatum]|uniref:Uncharacterized protein n=1 Tax=Colletotrichum truncatum TaxID=5467 RepID=A0ACC3Z307_COLTU